MGLAVVLLLPVGAHAEHIVGCNVTYYTYSIPPPTSGYTKQDVCQNGICNWYHIPECGENCWVEICFASEDPEESAPSCSPTTDPGAVDIPCRVTRSFPIRNRHTGGTSAAYMCDWSGCTLQCLNMSYAEDIIADWNNGNWVTTGSREFYCDCERSSCGPPP
jgi:hypothetical protein